MNDLELSSQFSVCVAVGSKNMETGVSLYGVNTRNGVREKIAFELIDSNRATARTRRISTKTKSKKLKQWKKERKNKKCNINMLKEICRVHSKFIQRKNKEQLYMQRLQDTGHNEKMYVLPEFFSDPKLDRLQVLRFVCKKFNEITEKATKSNKYSVFLRNGIVKTAADFHFQYKIFLKWCRDNGVCLNDVRQVLLTIHATFLYKSCAVKQGEGKICLRRDIHEITQKLTDSEYRLLILYKGKSSAPERDTYEESLNPAITGLSDTRAAEILGKSRRTIQRTRERLMGKGFVQEISYNGRHRKIRINL